MNGFFLKLFLSPHLQVSKVIQIQWNNVQQLMHLLTIYGLKPDNCGYESFCFS